MEENQTAIWGGENLPLTFSGLQHYVSQRQKEAMAKTLDANITYYTTGLAEETGEVCGAVKKLVRAQMGLVKPKTLEKLREKMRKEAIEKNQIKIPMGAEKESIEISDSDVEARYQKELYENLEIEIGQVVQYLCNICTYYGLDFDKVAKKSFNQTSKDFNSTILIP